MLSLQPEASIAHYPLALAYRDRGDAERAKEHLALRGEGAVRSRDPLVRELTTLSKLSALQVVLSQAADPQVAARDLVGFAIGQLAGVEGAVDYLRAAIEQRPAGEESVDPFARSRVLDVVGALLVEQGRLDDAARAFEQALAVAPDLADAGGAARQSARDASAGSPTRSIATTPCSPGSRRTPRHCWGAPTRSRTRAGPGGAGSRSSAWRRSRPGRGASCCAPPLRSSGWGAPIRRCERYREAASIAANDAQAATAQAGIGRLLAARGEDQAALDALAAARASIRPQWAPRLELAALEAELRRYQEAARHYGEAVDARRPATRPLASAKPRRSCSPANG